MTESWNFLPEVYAKGIYEQLKQGSSLRAAMDTRTDEEREAAGARHRAKMQVWVAAQEALAALTDGAARVVLDLHHRTPEGCAGCDFGGWESEPPEYPCRTVYAIAAAYGIPMPAEGWVG